VKTGHSIQVIETRHRHRQHRWLVGVFFPGCRRDRRFALKFHALRRDALRTAFAYARSYLPGATFERFNEDWLAWSPDGRMLPIIIMRTCR
jgi:hypothetical protein